MISTSPKADPSSEPSSEDELQRWSLNLINQVIPSECVVHHSPNEGVRKVQFKMKLKSMGTQFGWPDLEIFAPDTATHTGLPQCLFIELKLAKGKLSPNQISIRDQLIAGGFAWALCRSLDDVREFLSEHLKVRAI